MARKARVEFEGAVYHVLDRGDRREAIFQDDADRRRFLESLGARACEQGEPLRPNGPAGVGAEAGNMDSENERDSKADPALTALTLKADPALRPRSY